MKYMSKSNFLEWMYIVHRAILGGIMVWFAYNLFAGERPQGFIADIKLGGFAFLLVLIETASAIAIAFVVLACNLYRERRIQRLEVK